MVCPVCGHDEAMTNIEAQLAECMNCYAEMYFRLDLYVRDAIAQVKAMVCATPEGAAAWEQGWAAGQRALAERRGPSVMQEWPIAA